MFYSKYHFCDVRQFLRGDQKRQVLLPLLSVLKVALCLLPQFQSHQIFHVLVVAAAFVHFYGVSNLQEFRYGLEGGCTDDSLL